MPTENTTDYQKLFLLAQEKAIELGFDSLEVTDTNLDAYTPHYLEWLNKNFHGEMKWMEKNISLRTDPKKLLPDTLRVLTVRMNYWKSNTRPISILKQPAKGYIARYALGKDYHKLIRKKLAHLAAFISDHAPHHYRVFTDSAPVMEKALAEKSGQGWIGKNTLLITPKAGSYFLLGEIFTNIPFPFNDISPKSHCGSCQSCIDLCPTKAIVKPKVLDSRRCIAYLTIEYKGSIPIELRPLIGNHIFGCDICQLVCPWNRFAKDSKEIAFEARHQLDGMNLLDLWQWNESEFLNKVAGMPLRRLSFEQWQRNLATAIGNSSPSPDLIKALNEGKLNASELVKEHIDWAIKRLITQQKT